MDKRIIIAGGSGLIGSRVARALTNKGYKVIIFTRGKNEPQKKIVEGSSIVMWDNKKTDEWSHYLDGAKAVMNFSGANIGRRWTREYKDLIYSSRIDTTKAISEVILNCSNPPETFINASAVGYYGDTNDRTTDESSPAGRDFMAVVCKDWESAAMKASGVTRVVTPRMGVVLDKHEGALPKMVLPFRFYAGGPVAGGNNWFSWVDIDDLVNMILFVLDRNISGAVNLTSPQPVKMKDVSKAIGKALHSPSWLPVPEFALRLLYGEGADPLLMSYKVVPDRIIKAGYKFMHENFDVAVDSILEGSRN